MLKLRYFWVQNLEDMDSDDWGSDSESDSDSEGSEDEADMLKGRAKWLKKTDDTSDKKKRKDEKRAAKIDEGKKGRKEKVCWGACGRYGSTRDGDVL